MVNELDSGSGDNGKRKASFSSLSPHRESGTRSGIPSARGERSQKTTGIGSHVTEEAEFSALTNPAEQMRPVLRKALLGMNAPFQDGFYAWREVNGEVVKISTQATSLNRDYLQRYPDGAAGIERHEEALHEGWGSIGIEFKVAPDKQSAASEQVSSYHYDLVIPKQLDSMWGGEDLATILGVSTDTVLKAEETIAEKMTQNIFAEDIVNEIGKTNKDVLGVDLTKPVVVAITRLGNGNVQREVLGEPDESNVHHYKRLQALYTDLSSEKDRV